MKDRDPLLGPECKNQPLAEFSAGILIIAVLALSASAVAIIWGITP